uniref:Leishmanolysin-like peptidase n=1 Tax=Caenorhabditis japonica TaxID=281687 RepID=A0A8R1HGL8_CAEJA
MISRYVKKSRSAIRSYLNNPLYYGKKKSTGRPRKITSRDERNIIRVVSNSPKSLNDVRTEFNRSVCKQTVHNAITKSGTIVRQNITRNHMKRRSQLVHHETLFLFSNGVEWSSAHDENPRIEDILLEVPIEHEHPHRHRRGIIVNKSNKPVAEKFAPLRIHLHYDKSIQNLTTELQIFVNTTLLPEAVGYWENALRVRPMKGPIRLRRKCMSSFYYYKQGMRNVACDKACRELTTCGEADIPADHLLDCLACNNTDDCQTTGNMGVGVNDSDFILYVTAHNSKRCEGPDTLSYAAHCQQEVDFDRPIAGNVNLCPSALSVHNHDYEILTSTVKHEILHALGFSVGLYAFFRDKEGKPRTKRNRYGRPTSLNKQKGYYDWDSNTITTVLREDWWTGDGKVVHPIHMMVTPKVREEARRHFGCDKLEGAELENQGGEGTYLTHWEKRAYENEAMTGTHTQNPVYSRLTLAFLEDTGWYQPNYEVAEDLNWGKQLGCDFAMKSCGEWIHEKKILGQDTFPYCSDIKHDGTKSMAITRCTAQRDSLALCNLVPFKKELPQQYRNFISLPGVNPVGAKYYGGSVEMADYCPFLQEFEWKLIDRKTHKDSRCELEGNGKEGEDILEVYGQNSRCFEFPKPWTERKCGRIRVLSHYMAGCYEYQCTNGTLYVGSYNATDMYPCYAPNQKIHVKKIVDGWLREGSIICPKCEDYCGENCGPPITIPDYIGDPEIDEPCGSFVPFSIFMIFLYFTIFLYMS